MPLKFPESMDECAYFTRRADGEGKTVCWVFRQKCPKCGKALMSKPFDEKKGTVKIRAKEYVCSACGHTQEKESYESSLTANITYTCPKCKYQGETQVPFKRKVIQGVKALVFNCQKCSEKILITKKMKAPKNKEDFESEVADYDD